MAWQKSLPQGPSRLSQMFGALMGGWSQGAPLSHTQQPVKSPASKTPGHGSVLVRAGSRHVGCWDRALDLGDQAGASCKGGSVGGGGCHGVCVVCSGERDHWLWALTCGERTQQGCSSGVGGRGGTGTAQC